MTQSLSNRCSVGQLGWPTLLDLSGCGGPQAGHSRALATGASFRGNVAVFRKQVRRDEVCAGPQSRLLPGDCHNRMCALLVWFVG